MKKTVWITDNRSLFESEHKTFNKKVAGIGTGNRITPVQWSGYIRPYNETECSGITFPPGHLQECDLTWIVNELPEHIKNFIRSEGGSKTLIAYIFFHWSGKKQIFHGYVITDDKYRLVGKWYANHSKKSASVVDEAIKYITEEEEVKNEK